MTQHLLIGSLTLAFAVSAVGCAIGSVDDPDFGNGGAGGSGVVVVPNGSGGATSSSSTDSTSDPSTTGSQTSSSSGPGTCGLTEHLCDGVCAQNTPETGCFKSSSCFGCSVPTGGTANCTAQGECDYECTAPNVKDGSGGCVDPNAGSGSGSGGGSDPMCMFLCLLDPASASASGCVC